MGNLIKLMNHLQLIFSYIIVSGAFVTVQKEKIEKEKKEEEDKRYGRTKYANDLREQIREREQKHIAERAAFFEEGTRLKEEAYQRRLRLDQIKRKKLEEL
eukprot:g30587.t1